MSLLEWKDEYRTGFPSIDYEHQTLILAINDIFEDSSSDQESLLSALAEIHALVEAHFALEEKIMRDQRYPAYIPHKQDHERLLDEIRDIMDAVEKYGKIDTGVALGERLSAWFAVHFASLDKDLHAMIGA
ncbi:MAG: hemerythrin family protein [Rhodospirillaceae bacterium]|nr:hemerythrin family protein [Rhodospirillaceae bacterium]MBL6940569.1 hemerythrin family protein [Rhodospirillales bacterium]